MMNRDQLIYKLKEKNIGTNYGAQCIPAQIYYQAKYNHDVANRFPNALQLYQQGLVLPLYEKMTKQNVVDICEIINELCKK
jgi:dTDP-4-amino-4,6-dideoxygalactose transaminase